MNDEEKAMMAEHFTHWKAKLDRGDVMVFGPVLEPSGPYGVVAAADEGAGIRRQRSRHQVEPPIRLRGLSDARGHARRQ